MRLRPGPSCLLSVSCVVLLSSCGDGAATSAVGTTTAADGTSGSDGQIGDSTGLDDGGTGDGSSVSDTTSSDGSGATAGTDGSGPDTVQDVPAAKYGKCSDLLSCAILNCAPDFKAGCQDLCVAAASPEANAAIAPVFSCIDTVCRQGKCAGSADATCMGTCAQQKCGYKSIECAADGKSGTTKCGGTFACLDACKSDLACLGGCYGSLSPSAQADYDALMACAATSSGSDAFKACPGQALQCVSGGVTGAAGCWDTLQCLNSCAKEDGGCAGTCYGKATGPAQKALLAASACFENGTDPNCPALLTECIDPKGTQSCVQVIACADKCKKDGGGDDCGLTCLLQASKAEAQKFLALAQCSDAPCKACSTDACKATCAKDKCPSQWSACLGQ